MGTSQCAAADLWGGSIAVTSDYLVRGISRSDERPALQLDVHYLSSSGILAGLFASNTRIDADLPTDAELNAFVGYAWASGSDWHGRILAGHYAYPWNRAGSGYNYDQLDVDLDFRQWLDIDLVYSPNAPRYTTYRGLIGVASESAEVNVRRPLPLLRRLTVMAGIGYSHYGGPNSDEYAYWSLGAVYDLAPVSLVMSYVDTSSGAKALFYNAASQGRWTGTVIWRF